MNSSKVAHNCKTTNSLGSKKPSWIVLSGAGNSTFEPSNGSDNWESCKSWTNHCQFCGTQISVEETLCFCCFNKAWEVAKRCFETEDINLMIEKANGEFGADTIYVQYASVQHKINKDMTRAQLFIEWNEAIWDPNDDKVGDMMINIRNKNSHFWTQAQLKI